MLSCQFSQYLVPRDGQRAHAPAGGVGDGVGNRRRGENDSRFTRGLGAEGAIAVVGFDEGHLDIGNILVGQMPGPVIAGTQRLAVAGVVKQVLVECLADALDCRAANLVPGRGGIDDATGFVNCGVLEHSRRAHAGVRLQLPRSGRRNTGG